MPVTDLSREIGVPRKPREPREPREQREPREPREHMGSTLLENSTSPSQHPSPICKPEQARQHVTLLEILLILEHLEQYSSSRIQF